MTDSIHAILSPLLILSYIFGARIIEFPASKPRPRLGIIYMLLSWSVYSFLIVYTVMHYVYDNSTIYHVCFRLDIFTATLSTVLGLYYNKKFKNCLRKLSIVDDTLEKLGTTMDYQKLYIRVLTAVFGWFIFVIWKTYGNSIWYLYTKAFGDRGAMELFYIAFMLDYCTFLNLINDLIIASVLGYIELKFDQVNEYLRKLEKDNEHEIRRTRNDFMLLPHSNVYSKSKNCEYVTWIVIHLHLELRRISRELNSIFGLQMTVKIGTYFAFISLGFREIFNIMLIKNYLPRIVLFFVNVVTMLVSNIFRLFLINYMCERVSVKANATGDIINKISYNSYTVVIRENISQLILQISQSPLRFYGLGLFQFGLKFLHGFTNSVATVIVILIQSHINT